MVEMLYSPFTWRMGEVWGGGVVLMTWRPDSPSSKMKVLVWLLDAQEDSNPDSYHTKNKAGHEEPSRRTHSTLPLLQLCGSNRNNQIKTFCKCMGSVQTWTLLNYTLYSIGTSFCPKWLTVSALNVHIFGRTWRWKCIPPKLQACWLLHYRFLDVCKC